MVDNPLGRPQYVTRDQLVRAVQNLLGILAGVFLAVGGLLWGYWSDDSGVGSRIGVSAGAVAAGAGLAAGLIKYMDHVRNKT